MPRLYDESEDDDQTFFDTADHFSTSSSCSSLDSLGSNSTDLSSPFDIWISEPLQSVEERRRSFLNQMGILEMVDVHKEELGRMDMERVVESSEAVSSCSSECCSEESLGSGSLLSEEEREMNGRETNFTADLGVAAGYSEFEHCHVAEWPECKRFKKRVNTWWKSFVNKAKRNHDVLEPSQKLCRIKVRQDRKKSMDFSAVYVGQEFCAHDGVIRTMKFSPDEQYLASGGEDGIVRIWRVTSANTPSSSLFDSHEEKRKKSCSIVVPDKDFKIQELPLHEFHGHTSDVLDLAWSYDSNCLLSSSEDKTVRLWKVGRGKCLSVFHHYDYVTCIQFNPVDGNYFISGSIDGKVRMWDVSENRVVNWTDAREVVTAISYQPNGNGFIVGTLTGSCRFYEASGSDLQLTAEVHIDGRKRSCGTRITGIQFLKEASQRIMVTSDDSKVRILDGVDVIQKYRGLPNSGSQMSASFTSDGRHIISVGEDSRVYIWNYESTPCIQSSKQRRRSISSCEHFFSKGVSLAIPWSSGTGELEQKDLGSDNQQRYSYIHSYSQGRDEERSSFANCFYGSSATWPEEKLPSFDEQDDDRGNGYDFRARSETWGLVIVTAVLDGTIRTFHNYGLPIRI